MAKLPKQSRGERLALIVIGLLAVSNLGYQTWLSSHQTKLLGEANTNYLILAIVSQTMVYFALMPAYRAYFSAEGIDIPYLSAFRLIISGIGLGKIVPLGEYLVWRRQLRSHDGGTGAVTRFMIVYYAIMFSSLICLFLISELLIFTVFHRHLSSASSNSFTLIPIAFTAAGVIIAGVGQIPPVKRAILNFFSKQLGSPLYAPWSILKNLHYMAGDVAILIASITLTLLVEATTLALCMRALGLNPSIVLVFYGYSFTRIFSLIPILPGGVGEVEAGMAFFFAAYGYPVSSILTATVLFRLLTYWIPILIGGISYARLGHEHEPIWQKLHRPLTSKLRST